MLIFIQRHETKYLSAFLPCDFLQLSCNSDCSVEESFRIAPPRMEIRPNGVVADLQGIRMQAADTVPVESLKIMFRETRLRECLVPAEKIRPIQPVERQDRDHEQAFDSGRLRLHGMLGSIGGFVLVIASLSVYLHHQRLIIRQQSLWLANYRHLIATLTEKYDGLKEHCEHLSSDLNASSKEETHLLSALENRLNGLQRLLDKAYSGTCNPKTFVATFKTYAASIKEEDNAFLDLRYVVNKRYGGIVDHLQIEYSNLTSEDLNLLSMLLFGFSFDCIRLLFDHDNQDSLYS